MIAAGIDLEEELARLDEGAFCIVAGEEVPLHLGTDLGVDLAGRSADPLGIDGDVLLHHIRHQHLRRRGGRHFFSFTTQLEADEKTRREQKEGVGHGTTWVGQTRQRYTSSLSRKGLTYTVGLNRPSRSPLDLHSGLA